MNRLFYSSTAMHQLSAARSKKLELLRLDSELSSIQTNMFILQLKDPNGIELQMAKAKAQIIDNERNKIIFAIADDTCAAIENIIKAVLLSMQVDSSSLIMLDDHMMQNIASFINEYYKKDEIKHAIKNRISFSQISYNIMQLSFKAKHFMPGLMSLQNTLR
ncbi:MAG: hypothetical protein J6R59_05935 [Paludibacteraceae bacterium]|nr:hypothetical protein [Paludibacteraceae bacterium]